MKNHFLKAIFVNVSITHFKDIDDFTAYTVPPGSFLFICLFIYCGQNG